MIHELFPSPTETAFGCHPCRVVSVTYRKLRPLHGGNTGSNPVGDANKTLDFHEPAVFLHDPISAKRQKAPDVLTPEDPLRTIIELDAFAGLRRGELIGLRWQDVDFESLILHIRRSVAAMVEGAPKTEASLKDVPLDAQTAESL